MKSFFKHNWQAIAGVIICSILLTFLLAWFRVHINNQIEKTTQAYLDENVSALSTVFYTKLDDQLVMLESQTRYFANVDLSDYNLMKKTIMSTKGIGEFKSIGVANSFGATMNYNGKSAGNVFLTDYYQTAMSGVDAISEATVKDENNNDVLVLAVPIMRNGTAAGIVYGTFTEEILNSLVDTVNFAESATNVLIDKNGGIIARTTSTEILPEDAVNFFDEVPAAARAGENSNTTLVCNINNNPVTIVMTPIGAHDWYFATMLPGYVIKEQSAAILRYVYAALIGIVLIFGMILISIIMLMRNNELVLRRNERLNILNAQAQSIIFDYSIDDERLTMEGDIELILNDQKGEYSYEETMDILSLIHEADRGIIRELTDVQNSNANTIHGETRWKCVDGKYYWFKMKATIVRAYGGRAVRIIGNLVNVDEQMNKELSLIKMAELDSLTGILNKGTFESHVDEMLTDRAVDEVGILFIIDLDNFKNVNDTLGHVMGDKVLCDVSRKLSEIFDENDLIGRIGGDEFAAFIPVSGERKTHFVSIAREKGEAVCVSVKETYRANNMKADVSASVGIAVFPDGGTDYLSLYKSADEALYRVKEKGKNKYEIYNWD